MPERRNAVDDDPAPTVAFDLPSSYKESAFVVNMSPHQETPTQINPFTPVRETPSTQRVSKNYVIAVFVGLLLGGFLVLAAFFIFRGFGERETTVGNTSQNKNSIHNVDTERANTNSKKSSEIENENYVNANANYNRESGNKKYNGRVITLNAYVRSAPDQFAPEIDVLPLDDRLIIGKRASANSPWYRVTCEHGIKGWIHGNTIEFTRQ